MEFRFEERADRIDLSLHGDGRAEELRTVYRDLLEIVHRTGIERVLVDSRDSRIHPSFDEMREIAKFTLEMSGSLPPRTALIVSDGLQFGLARIFGSLIEFSGWKFKIFRDTESAVHWLQES